MTVRPIVLVVSSLQGGGAERFTANLAKTFVDHGQDVVVVTLTEASRDVIILPSPIEIVCLGMKRVNVLLRPISYPLKLFKVRSTLRSLNPRGIISIGDVTNVAVLAACYDAQIPIVVSERTDPRHHDIGPLFTFLRRMLYKRARAVVVQTESVANWAREFVPGRRVHVIPNAFVADRRLATTTLDLPKPFILSVGRLEHPKGHDRLLQAFAAVPVEQRIDWSIRLLGTGSQEQTLRTLAADLGIGKQVYFDGFHTDVGSWLNRADIFALTSRYEGFPNALLEAMGAGVASVSFRCPSGPEDIIRNGENGVLIQQGDTAAFSDALSKLMGDPQLRAALGQEAKNVRDRFCVNQIASRWLDLVK